ncbi:TPA: hypothetical protein H1012_02915 [archaeon]|nr:hypothetical protein [Candidatus Naiadarchaeales archaeon SRR2090153.bin461]HIK02772.1 hypothetical protein [Candidatus Naiadarchaeales archaeon SRR2090159.bin1288]
MNKQQTKNLRIILKWEKEVIEFLKKRALQEVDIQTGEWQGKLLEYPPYKLLKAAKEIKKIIKNIPRKKVGLEQRALTLAAYGLIQKSDNQYWHNYDAAFYRNIRKVVDKNLGENKYLYLIFLVYFSESRMWGVVIPGLSQETMYLLQEELYEKRGYSDTWKLFQDAESFDFKPLEREGEEIVRKIFLPLIKERSKSDGCYLERNKENNNLELILQQDPESPTKIANSVISFGLFMMGGGEPCSIEMWSGEEDEYLFDLKYSDFYKELTKENPAPYIKNTILRRNF